MKETPWPKTMTQTVTPIITPSNRAPKPAGYKPEQEPWAGRHRSKLSGHKIVDGNK